MDLGIRTNIYIYIYRKEQHGTLIYLYLQKRTTWAWVSEVTYIFIFTEKNNMDLGIGTNLLNYFYRKEQHGPGHQYC